MSFLRKLASFENDIDFRRAWRVGVLVSLAAMVIALGAIGLRGLNLGIEFEGGTSWEVPARDLSVEQAREALRPVGEAGARVRSVGTGGGRTLSVHSSTAEPEQVSSVTAALAQAAGVERHEVTVSTVGPTWGQALTQKAQQALVIFFIAIGLYMAIRLEWKMAIGALAAVAHDIVVAVGFYALFQLEVTPATVIAFLTILGYSVYDTIVVFDRVHENTATLVTTGKASYTDTVSLSLNQVLMRSVNTTVTSLVPVIALLVIGSYVLGAATLEEFAIALLVGLFSGAYSSIFVAAPVLAWVKEREPRMRELRRRAEGRAEAAPAGGAAPGATPVPAAVGAGALRAPAGVTGPSGRQIPPRPRKKGRR